MTDSATATPAEAAPEPADSSSKPPARAKEEGSFLVFLLKLAVIVLVFRSFIFAPFSIPSESMLPELQDGDHLIASKWSYGFSKYSLPLSAPLIPGRIFPSQPERGDVAIFRAPPLADEDYVKRVIGLPGDQIQVKAGLLYINGKPVKREKLADFEIAVSPNTHCRGPQYESTRADGSLYCHYPQYRETLPNGVSYNILDLGPVGMNFEFGVDPDNTEPVIVPAGMLFMMGDNRDNSLDSRFPAVPGAGIGLVPQANLVGKAQVMMWSTDGAAQWLLPWTWFTAARWNRIGMLL